MYAVFEACGKQYKAEPGDILFLEKLDLLEGDEVVFDKVLAAGREDGIMLGSPYIDGLSVVGKVIKNGKSKKVTVFKYRPKKDSKSKMGHRQPYTKVQIEDIKG